MQFVLNERCDVEEVWLSLSSWRVRVGWPCKLIISGGRRVKEY